MKPNQLLLLLAPLLYGIIAVPVPAEIQSILNPSYPKYYGNLMLANEDGGSSSSSGGGGGKEHTSGFSFMTLYYGKGKKPSEPSEDCDKRDYPKDRENPTVHKHIITSNYVTEKEQSEEVPKEEEGGGEEEAAPAPAEPVVEDCPPEAEVAVEAPALVEVPVIEIEAPPAVVEVEPPAAVLEDCSGSTGELIVEVPEPPAEEVPAPVVEVEAPPAVEDCSTGDSGGIVEAPVEAVVEEVVEEVAKEVAEEAVEETAGAGDSGGEGYENSEPEDDNEQNKGFYYVTSYFHKKQAQGGGDVAAEGGGAAAAEGGGDVAAEGGGEVAAEGGGEVAAEGGGEVAAEGGGEVAAEGGGEVAAEGGGEVVAEEGGETAEGGGAEGGGGDVAVQVAAESGITTDSGINDAHHQLEIIFALNSAEDPASSEAASVEAESAESTGGGGSAMLQRYYLVPLEHNIFKRSAQEESEPAAATQDILPAVHGTPINAIELVPTAFEAVVNTVRLGGNEGAK